MIHVSSRRSIVAFMMMVVAIGTTTTTATNTAAQVVETRSHPPQLRGSGRNKKSSSNNSGTGSGRHLSPSANTIIIGSEQTNHHLLDIPSVIQSISQSLWHGEDEEEQRLGEEEEQHDPFPFIVRGSYSNNLPQFVPGVMTLPGTDHLSVFFPPSSSSPPCRYDDVDQPQFRSIRSTKIVVTRESNDIIDSNDSHDDKNNHHHSIDVTFYEVCNYYTAIDSIMKQIPRRRGGDEKNNKDAAAMTISIRVKPERRRGEEEMEMKTLPFVPKVESYSIRKTKKNQPPNSKNDDLDGDGTSPQTPHSAETS